MRQGLAESAPGGIPGMGTPRAWNFRRPLFLISDLDADTLIGFMPTTWEFPEKRKVRKSHWRERGTGRRRLRPAARGAVLRGAQTR